MFTAEIPNGPWSGEKAALGSVPRCIGFGFFGLPPKVALTKCKSYDIMIQSAKYSQEARKIGRFHTDCDAFFTLVP